MHNNVFWILRPAGRLGNQLSTYAYFMSHCLENDGTLINFPFEEYGQYFQGTVENPSNRFPPKPDSLKSGISRKTAHMALRTLDRLDKYTLKNLGRISKGSLIDEDNMAVLKTHKHIVPTSWWISDFEALVKHQDAVREYFKPVEGVQKQIDANMATLRSKSDFVIGIHIRQTDYQSVVPDYYYTHEIYADYMRQAANLFADKSPTFFICSDSPVPEEPFAEFDYVSFSQGPVEDMYTLAACDRIIGTKSSFNSWASFYGRVPMYWIVGKQRPLLEAEFLRFAPGFIPQHSRQSLCGQGHAYFGGA